MSGAGLSQCQTDNTKYRDIFRDDIKSSSKFAIFSYLKIEGGGFKGKFQKKYT